MAVLEILAKAEGIRERDGIAGSKSIEVESTTQPDRIFLRKKAVRSVEELICSRVLICVDGLSVWPRVTHVIPSRPDLFRGDGPWRDQVGKQSV